LVTYRRLVIHRTWQPSQLRRNVLERFSGNWCPPIQLTPQTTDVEVAERWLEEDAAIEVGVEGLVVKVLGQMYRPGVAGWRKYRIRHTREAVVGAVTGTPAEPQRLVLALPPAGHRSADPDGGVTLPLTARDLAAVLQTYTGADLCPPRRSSRRSWPRSRRTRRSTGDGGGTRPDTCVGAPTCFHGT
jgi:hypothetical protein